MANFNLGTVGPGSLFETGSLNPFASDQGNDFYAFTASQSETVSFQVSYPNYPGYVPWLELLSQNGSYIDSSTNGKLSDPLTGGQQYNIEVLYNSPLVTLPTVSYSLSIVATGSHITPTLSGQSFSISANQSTTISPYVTLANKSADSITGFYVEDLGGGTGHLSVGGTTEPNNQWIQVSSNWSNVQYFSGPSAGTDTLALAVFDATTNSYVYNSGTFTAATTASAHVPASINAHSFSVSANSPISASSFFSVSNPSGDNVSQYSFLDEGANGHFSVGGVAQPDGQWINITPNNLSSVQYFGGPTAGNENLEVAIFDATTNAGYEQLITATTTAPSQVYSITPGSPTIQENAGTEIFTIARTDASQQATFVVSTVHDLGTDNPNMSTYYQGILNQPITFNAGQYQVQIPLTIHDLYLTAGSESFRLIVQQTVDPNYNNYLVSDTFTIVNKDSPVAVPVHANDLGYSGTASGFNHFIDLLNFEASYGDLVHAFGTNQQAMQNWYSASEPHESRIETFDGLDYIASYGDLIHTFAPLGSIKGVQDAGATHFITNGLAEGRSTTFNGLDYIASYNDLMSAFGANNDAGAFHFIENGQREGRTTTFDGLDYIASYGDLIQAFGANEQAGAAHFITNGRGEGRTTTFDGLSYIAQYADLMLAFGTNGDAGAMHYITNGVQEGRSTAFNVAGYEQAHPDLIGVYNTNDAFLTAYIHTYTSTGHFLV